MKPSCDHIRRRALEHGEGTPEYEVWVRHSLHCPECRSELYIHELLKEDGCSRGTGLSAESVASLMSMAEVRYRGGWFRRKRALARLWHGAWRVAGVAAVAYVLCAAYPHVMNAPELPEIWGVTAAATSPDTASAGASGNLLALSSGEDGVGLSVPMERVVGMSSSSSCETVPVSTVALDSAAEPEMLSGWDVEDAIQNCRRKIDRERERLYDSLEADGIGRK